jgi:basic amino acid/polyamine antiporter, APA family
VWAVLLAGIAAALLVFCFAEASSYFDQAGGAYLYTREAFGQFVGFEVGWMTWLGHVASIASLANGLVQATAHLWPAAADSGARAMIICGLLSTLAWINASGVRAGASAAVVLVVGKMLPLAFFIVVGVWFVDGARLTPIEVPHMGSLGQAALLLLFAYGGFENIPAAAGEYRDPRRDVPFALWVMIPTVTLLYAAVQIVALGTLPELARSSSPLAQAAGRFAGDRGAWLLTVGAVLSIAGNAGNKTLIAPRYLFALALDGYGPPWLARIHGRYRTPANAIFVHTGIALLLALTGSFVQLATLSVMARLAAYIGTAAALPILRKRRAGPAAPTHPLLRAALPVAALGLSIGLLASASKANLLAAAAALGVGALVYRMRQAPRAAAERGAR